MSNILKGYWVSVEDDTRMVDSNELVDRKVKEAEERRARLNLIFGDQNGSQNTDEDSEFSEGLNAESLDALLGDDSQSSVIKNEDDYFEGQTTENQFEEGQFSQIQFGDNQFEENQGDFDSSISNLERAQEELEKIKLEAAEILEEANREADEIKQRAYEEGQTQGYEDGNRRANEEIEAIKADLLRQSQEMAEDYERELEELEPKFVDALTDIYEHIFKVDLESIRGMIIYLLADAINSAETTGGIIVHVSRDDYPMIMNEKEELLVETGMTEDRIEFIQDATLKTGGAMIETPNGIFDCSLETELKELKRKLMIMAYQRD